MTGPVQAFIAAGSVVVLLVLMALVRAQARRHGLGGEVQRKLVHMGTGLYALGLPWIFADDWPVYMLIGLTLVVMGALRLPGVAKGGLGATLHGVERQSWGDVLLALAVGVVFLLSDGRAILYILPIAILTLSDAAAALTGSRYGRSFFKVEAGQKSLEGSVAFFAVTLILSMICLLLLSDIPRANVILVSLIVAAFGTLIEADSWRGFDNFFLPAGLLVFLEAHMTSGSGALVLIALVFGAAIWAAHALAPRAGLGPHEGRVFVISAFLLYSVTAPQNIVLPLLALVAHQLAHRNNPCSSDFAQLDIVAAVALTSFGWLTLGHVTGRNALPFFGLTALGLTVGLVALAYAREKALLRWVSAVAMAMLLLAAYHWLMAINSGPSGWADNTFGLSLCTGALTLAVPGLWPGWFHRQRALRLTLLALVCPSLGYLWLGTQAGWAT